MFERIPANIGPGPMAHTTLAARTLEPLLKVSTNLHGSSADAPSSTTTDLTSPLRTREASLYRVTSEAQKSLNNFVDGRT
eukprot:6202256-Pleurochrysis_carterae.AAC.1